MGFKYTYTEEQYNAVMFLAETGFTMREVSRKTGVPYDTVRGWVKRGNKPLNAWTEEDWARKVGNNQATRDEWSEERREEFINVLKEQKLGEKNPMWEKFGDEHPMWKNGSIHEDVGRARIRRKFKPVIDKLIEITGVKWDIHHIDGNSFNNEDDNLAISTRKGHMTIDGRLEKVTKTFTENNPGTHTNRGGEV